MKIYVHAPVEFGGRTFEPGVHDVSQADADALYIRGAVRPATMAEACAASAPAVETAEVSTGKRRK